MSTTEAENTPLRLIANPEFVALAAVRFASGMTLATIIIALALYADAFEVSGVVAGLFGTAYAVIRLFLVLPLGRYVDIGDARRYLLAGTILTIVTLVGFMQVGSAVHVVLLRALQGVASILIIIAGATIVGEISPDGERGLWLGTYNQAHAFASLSGDIAGGALLFLFGFGVTYSVLAVITGIATVLAFAFVRRNPGGRSDPEENTGVETVRLLLARPAVKALVVFRFAFSFGKMAVIIFLPVFARTQFGMSAFAIGGILAGGRITKAVAQGYVGTISDRIGHREWFVFGGTLLYALGTALFPFALYTAGYFPSVVVPVPGWVPGAEAAVDVPSAFFWLFFAYVLLGIGDSLRLPTSMAMFVEEGEHHDAVAGSLSLRSVSWQFGSIVGPLAVGGMLDYTSYFEAFWLAAALMVAASFVFMFLYKAVPSPEARTTTADD